MNLAGMLSRISTRERTMLVALVLVGFLIWLSILWRRWESVSLQLRKTTLEFEQQAVWLDDADRFGRELGETLSLLDPEATFDADGLVALIDTLSRSGGLKHELTTPSTIEREVFLEHTLRVGIRNAPLARLIDFERSLQTRHPYAAIEDFSLTAGKTDPRLLNARLTVTSYQLEKARAAKPEARGPETAPYAEEPAQESIENDTPTEEQP